MKHFTTIIFAVTFAASAFANPITLYPGEKETIRGQNVRCVGGVRPEKAAFLRVPRIL